MAEKSRDTWSEWGITLKLGLQASQGITDGKESEEKGGKMMKEERVMQGEVIEGEVEVSEEGKR